MPDNAGESAGNGNGLFNGKETLPIDGAGVKEAPRDNDGTTVTDLPLIWAKEGAGIKSNASKTRIIAYSVLGKTCTRKSPKA